MAIKIYDKWYVTVAERVQSAHAEEGFSMLSEEVFSIGERHFVRITIDVKGKQYIGSAEIKFNARANTPDGTNPLECAATSAVGRALGFASYGSIESIASADEIIRSENAQEWHQNGHQRAQSNGQAKQHGKADNPLKDKLNAVYALGKSIGCYTDISTFSEFVRGVLILDIEDVRLLNAAQLGELEEAILQIRQQQEGPDPDVLQSLAEAALEARVG